MAEKTIKQWADLIFAYLDQKREDLAAGVKVAGLETNLAKDAAAPGGIRTAFAEINGR